MTAPADEPKKPKKRTEFGKRTHGIRKLSLAEQQRKVAAWMEFIKPDTPKGNK
jgi:hypothetical protein